MAICSKIAAALLAVVLVDTVHAQSSEFPFTSPQWTLLFRQRTNRYTGGAFWPNRNRFRLNADDPSNALYSIMDTLEAYRSTTGSQAGKFVFKLVYPGMCERSVPRGSVCSQRDGVNVVHNIWSQTSNPYTDWANRVLGYTPLDVNYMGTGNNVFTGIVRAASQSTLFDCNGNHGNWFYSLGAVNAWGGATEFPAMVGPGSQGQTFMSSQVELYVWGQPAYPPVSPSWSLVFRQSTGAGFQGWPADATGGRTGSDLLSSTPTTAAIFSNLSSVDAYPGTTSAGGHVYKIMYPGMCTFTPSPACDDNRNYVIFTQTSSLTAPVPATGYASIDIGAYTGLPLGSTADPVLQGLGNISTVSPNAALEITAGQPAYSIGRIAQTAGCDTCLPGPLFNGQLLSPTVELYVFLPHRGAQCNFATQYAQQASDGSWSCSYLTNCTLGSTYQSVAPTELRDRQCSPTTVCDTAGEYEAAAPTLVDDRQCLGTRTCLPTEFQRIAPTATTDRVCNAQPVCTPPLQYEAAPGTPTTSRVCVRLSSCDEQDAIVTPTATTDRICSDCLPDTQVLVTDATTMARTCVAAAICPASQYQAVPALNSNNTICLPRTTVCPSGQYMASPSTATSDAICVPVRMCSVGLEVETQAPTVSTDRVCGDACPACTGTGQLMQSSTCTAGAGRTCVSSTAAGGAGTGEAPQIAADGNDVVIQAGSGGGVKMFGADVGQWLLSAQSEMTLLRQQVLDIRTQMATTSAQKDQVIAALQNRVEKLELNNAQLRHQLP
eukprot:m.911611 g.911611  ORF g.911611 m.911611 type:complete len:774 (+) comp23725_c0_seq14:103-2424(+)